MKIRTDYVSNSSSSSYLVAVNKEDIKEPIPCAIVTREEYDLQKLVTRVITMVAELDKLYKREYGRNPKHIDQWDWEYGKSNYLRAKAALEAGQVLLNCDVESDMDGLQHHLYEEGSKGIEFPDDTPIKLLDRGETK